MTFERFDIVIVPFPFTDLPVVRRRPALVLSAAGWNAASGHIVCAMITSAGRSSWTLDVPVVDLAAAGLNAPCVVRTKLFTIEAGLVVRSAGELGKEDAVRIDAACKVLLTA